MVHCAEPSFHCLLTPSSLLTALQNEKSKKKKRQSPNILLYRQMQQPGDVVSITVLVRRELR